MYPKKLADEYVDLGMGGILIAFASPIYEMRYFEHEHTAGPEYNVIIVLLGEQDTWKLLAVAHDHGTPGHPGPDVMGPPCSVTDLSNEGWYVTRVEGSRTFVDALAAFAETLGARRRPD